MFYYAVHRQTVKKYLLLQSKIQLLLCQSLIVW